MRPAQTLATPSSRKPPPSVPQFSSDCSMRPGPLIRYFSRLRVEVERNCRPRVKMTTRSSALFVISPLPGEHIIADEAFMPMPGHNPAHRQLRPIPARLPLTQVNASVGTASHGRLEDNDATAPAFRSPGVPVLRWAPGIQRAQGGQSGARVGRPAPFDGSHAPQSLAGPACDRCR